jgi:hypothetical protein
LGCRVDYLWPFHSFFTILFDQSILVLYWLASRSHRSEQENGVDEKLPRWMLSLIGAASGFLLGPLSRLDTPWLRRGLSNGFLFAATKPQTSGMAD